MSTTDDGNLPKLISEVNQLNGNVIASALQMKRLQESHARLVTSRRRHRIALFLVSFSLAVDLCLTVIVFHLIANQNDFNAQQECTNSRSQKFFTAEHDKVAGQVAGLRKIQAAQHTGDQGQGLAGFNQFIDASQHYLDVIGHLSKC